MRDDFWASTSNKQLNFVQHVKTLLEDQRPRRGRRARQRAVRGRRRRDGPPQAAARVRRPHAAAAADRHLLRPGREGERAVLRPQAGVRDAVDAASCGSTTCARTSTSRSSRTRSRCEHLDDFVDVATSRTTARARVETRAVPAASPTTSSSRATRRASTSSGSATSRSRTPTTCPPPDVIAAGDRRRPRGGARGVQRRRRVSPALPRARRRMKTVLNVVRD